MPNNCTNVVTIEDENIKDIILFLQEKQGDETNPFSLNKIFPTEKDRCETWGTKWDTYEHGDVDTSEENKVVYNFFTAYTEPCIMSILSKMYPNAKIKHFYIEEGNEILGEKTFHNGKETSCFEPEWDSEEGLDFRSDHGFYEY